MLKMSLFLKARSQLTRSSHGLTRRAFSSDSKPTVPSSATVSTKPNLDDSLTVVALPLLHKPLVPGFFMPLYVKDPKVLAALAKSKTGQAPYAGAFLLKEQGAETESSSSSETEIIREKLKGNDLLNKLYKVGTLAQVLSIKGEQVILVGRKRLQITEMVSEDPLTVKTNHLKDKPCDKNDKVIKETCFEVIPMLRDVMNTTTLWKDQVQIYTEDISDFNYRKLAELLLEKKRRKSTEFRAGVFKAIDFNYHTFADFGARIFGLDKHKIQGALEELDVHKRLKLTLELLKKQVENNKIQVFHASIFKEKSVEAEKEEATSKKVKLSEPFSKKIESNREKIPKHVLKVIEEQITKLDRRDEDYSSTDGTYTYLEWLTAMPWGKCSDENLDLLRAAKILDEDHYGLSDVKERILEFIAVGILTGNSEGKIICLSGPPGVGKTSIGSSIARALCRKFFRFAVGGLSDVSEIKGDRGVYVGATPGKMVQCLKEVETENPLVLLDEIDKLGKKSSEADPASALLELLDPQQNSKFVDDYLDVTIDLSKVLFVCTANDIDRIPDPLQDRMEVIHVGGYTTDEKMHIARDYLLKTVCGKCGIKPEQVDVSDAALYSLIEKYCREEGVRNLQKHIEKIFRKIALKLVRNQTSVKALKSDLKSSEIAAEGSKSDLGSSDTAGEGSKSEQSREVAEKFMIDESNLAEYVGKPVFDGEKIYEETPIGVAMGLAWTSMGGKPIYIETSFVQEEKGKGGLDITGNLGNEMKESAMIAHTVARRIMLEKEPENLFFENTKLHLHVPKESTRKDGPSAGCTMITSLLSLAMKKPVRKDLTMTGEVTLTGRILAIGGVKEKTMAAKRSQVKVIIFPKANKRDFEDLDEALREGFDVHFVDEYEQIFKLAFGYDH